MNLKTLCLYVCLLFACSVALAQDRSTIQSYKTDTAPTVDGELDEGEWDAAGPWIEVTPDSTGALSTLDILGDADIYGGHDDGSFRFKSMWVEDTANFYLVFEVFDDIAMAETPRNPWEADQIEVYFDGTNLEGDDDINSYHWWDNVETYGKFGVGRDSTLEGNSGKVTTDAFVWNNGDIPALTAVSDIDNNADYRIEMAVSILPMLDDTEFAPYADTPTEDEDSIVEDSTTLKFTAGISDNDNVDGEDSGERSHELIFYRALDGEVAPWDQSTAFADLVFTGEFDGVIVEPIAGDCNGDGMLSAADLACQSIDTLAATLTELGVLPGDFDGNGAVEFPDFLTLSANFNMPGNYTQGDADGDGQVGFPDFLAMSGNFGKTAAAAAVPEPTSWLLMCFVGLALGSVRRRR